MSNAVVTHCPVYGHQPICDYDFCDEMQQTCREELKDRMACIEAVKEGKDKECYHI